MSTSFEVVGQITSGEHGSILIRQKSGETIEIGDLLIADTGGKKYLLQVTNLLYGSQMDSRNMQMIAGMHLEGKVETEFYERELRTYIMAEVKTILIIDEGGRTFVPKTLPPFLSKIRMATAEDLGFLKRPERPLYLGSIRSGSKVLDVPVYIDGMDAFTHHILIPATTGRGKSNLVKVMLWSTIGQDYCGVLVLDPHNEYYEALKDHPDYESGVKYYTPPRENMPRGATALMVNLNRIRPWHFNGIIHFTEAQSDALYVFRNIFGDDWLTHLLLHRTEDEHIDGTGLVQYDRPMAEETFHGVRKATITALQRKLKIALGLSVSHGRVTSRNNVFSTTAGENTVEDIITALENGYKVILDTSRMNEQTELLIASITASEIMDRYKNYKSIDALDSRPVISIVLEEAPRVLAASGSEPSIFGTIAREGRKFRVGLVAITQLVSVIPHQVLANMNTKIILGNEMAEERRAIIANASQDLSADGKMISSLDKGEAIVSSVFTRFAIPVKIPLFEEYRDRFLREAPERKETLIAFE